MRLRAKVVLAVILSGALGAASPLALAQSGAPSAKPKAGEVPKDKDKGKGDKGKGDKAAADAGAASDASAAPADNGGLPAGHPPVDQGLPSGHPPVGDDDDSDDEEAPPNPHGGGGQPHDSRIFQAPPDAAQDDPAVPVGSIVVSIRDAQDKPIPRAPITLGILHSSVAKGDSSERRAAEADAEGNARFDGLTTGSGTSYRVSTTRAAATYAIAPFQLGDRVGKRAVLHSYDVTSNVDSLSVGINGLVILSLREDSIQVEQLLIVGNPDPVSWVADAEFRLPEGFKAFNKQESMSDTRVDEVKDKGAALRGTFSPGRHSINFRYQVPLENTPKQTLHLELPPHMMAVRVAAESSRSMALEVAGMPGAQPLRNEGKRFLVTEWQMRRAEDAMNKLEITLTGLPTTGPGRWIALALAIASLLAGLVYFQQKRDTGALDPDTREDLVEAREALLQEIVELERLKKSGEVGPKTYARLRAALLDALARIVSMLDAAKAEQKRRRREARAAGSST